jgi:L-fucose isomerase-like protein
MTTFGILIGNRDMFPDHLVKEGRTEILSLMQKMGFETIILEESVTKHGAVESYDDAKKCAELFRSNRDKIDGIVVSLPNFGDEKGIANTLKMSDLNVPVLIQASSDEMDKMNAHFRRDAFCGKISVTSVLNQHGISYSLTELHTCQISSDNFKRDLLKFEKVCNIVNKIRSARVGQVGTRPTPFETVRYSEKILERNGISVEPISIAEVIRNMENVSEDDPTFLDEVEFLKNYTKTQAHQEKGLKNLAKLVYVLSTWVKENDLDGFAFQCWPSLQDYLGISACAALSVFNERLIPGACEVDVTGLIGMLILQWCTKTPSAILDWNNNYGNDPNKMVLFHCSNLPVSFLEESEMKNHQILKNEQGEEVFYGTIQGRIKANPCTLLRIDTDDNLGKIKVLLAEGEYTQDPLNTFGGYGVIHINNLQQLLKRVCKGGYAHHVAVNFSHFADVIEEAVETYLGWTLEYHLD